MNTEVQQLMEKAKRSLKTAEKIFKDGEVDFAGSRRNLSKLEKII
jgi:uncharacterized protein (UPF0332 family)